MAKGQVEKLQTSREATNTKMFALMAIEHVQVHTFRFL